MCVFELKFLFTYEANCRSAAGGTEFLKKVSEGIKKIWWR